MTKAKDVARKVVKTLRKSGSAKEGTEKKRNTILSQDDVVGACEHTGVTINRYMIEMTKRGLVDPELESIFNSISEASKTISKLVNRAPLLQDDLLGMEGNVNVQGEDQKKLDVITNEIFKNALKYTGRIGTLASEEEDTPVAAEKPEGNLSDTFADTGSYVCVFDPLDGSSNVDAGIPVGTIFGVFREPDDDQCNLADFSFLEELEEMSEEDATCLAATLQTGDSLVAAGYVLYSSSTEMVMSVGHGVVGFTLDRSISDFVLTRPNIVIPNRGAIYSMNAANGYQWDEPMQKYITDLRQGKGETNTKYSLRYIGSMVGDIHRTLLYGGIFAYPADAKNRDGKLRLLYEAAPMSFLLEQAGGRAITGHSRVLDIPPVNVHQRVPVILGSKEDVDECQKYYLESDDPTLKQRCENRLNGIIDTKKPLAA